ncbi:exopolysaccharide biosynthesis protein [Pseudophaeobacter arcticus]|uniref:CpsD/CapB family tyrosine-protein kinase n=1 Tax=Pseudophaeobacter arcticus TaxID=385492 RepID=UPI003A983919
MKHFAVSPSDGTPARPEGGENELKNTAPAFDGGGEDRMTQKGYKRFRRRNAPAPQQAGPEIGPEPETGPETGLETGPEVGTAANPLNSARSPAPAVQTQQPIPAPKAAPPEGTRPAPAPQSVTPQPAAVAAKPRTEIARPVETARPVRVKPRLELDRQARVDLPGEPPMDLPTRFDPWLQIPQVAFDFLGQKPSRLPLVSAFRASPTARAFDLLRTRLLHSLKAHGWKRVAVTSPSAGGGTTFCAVNLALSLARVPQSRTLLMDMNFRRPGIAAALGIPPHGDMSAFLAGEVPLNQHLQRLSVSLAVGSNCHPDHNASDILHDRRAADVISAMINETRADTVLFDLPPVLEHDDVTAFLPQVDGVLLISDGDRTTAAELAACEKMLAGHAPLLGVVLNKAHQSDKTQVTP